MAFATVSEKQNGAACGHRGCNMGNVKKLFKWFRKTATLHRVPGNLYYK